MLLRKIPLLNKEVVAICTVGVLLLTAVSFSLASDQQFNCPNNGIPKMEEGTGRPLQCLPGQSSKVVCGNGFSCFFSGFNYQCCPSGEDEDYEADASECPMGSYSVLNSDGSTMRCNSKKQCPKAGMFCSTLKSQTSCCEIFSAIRKIPVAEENKENQQKQQFEKHSKSSSVEISSSSTSNANSESMAARTNEAPIMVQAGEQSAAGNSETPSTATECPASSMTVLSETGEMIKCDEGNRCPGAGSFCTSSRFCCQPIDSDEDKRPNKEEPIRDETKGRLSADMRPSKKLSEIPDKRRSPGAKVLQFADNEGTIYSRPVGRKIHEGYAKARAAKIREGDALFELQGSSERLQRINSMKSNIEQRSKTQRFLVNQIKNGWPYDEKFYRPSEGGPPNNENTSSSFS